MKMKKTIFGWLALLMLITTNSAEGGTVFLKNGHVISGKVIASDAEKVILTWDNGRATIYRRFISEVVLDSAEQQYLARRMEAQVIAVAEPVNVPIQLPELSSLLPVAEAASEEPVEPVTELTVGESEDVLVEEETMVSDLVVVSEEKKPLPIFQREKFEGLGLEIDVPETWQTVTSSGAARVSSENGEVLIAVDRFSESDVSSEQAAYSLGDRLGAAGFASQRSTRSSMLTPLHPSFVQESTSPDGTKQCLHALLSSSTGGIVLLSVYTPVDSDSYTEGLISTMLASLGSPVAAK